MKKIFFLLVIAYNLNFTQNSINEKWLTKFETSNYFSTNNYAESIEYFERIANHSEFAQCKTIGISPQGRELKCLIVSKDKIFDPESNERNNKTVVLINNGIHSGEIEGKDASMLLLREILIEKEKLDIIDNLILLVIPVFNLDGHERSSPYGRINQNGPTEMGWRTTAQNLNLNRDFTKADSPEMKAFLQLYNTWLPELFIDNHTTNGADYQYTITYAISKDIDIPPASRKIVNEIIIPKIDADVKEKGFLISPFVGFIDRDYNKGIKDWIASPRFSNGYATIHNRIGLLIETHMLKPYKDRVFSTKALLESVIEVCSANSSRLNNAARQADEFVRNKYVLNKKPLPVSYKVSNQSVEFEFDGYERIERESKIAGRKVISYTNKKTKKNVPYFNRAVITDSVYLSDEYIIPREWSNLVEIIKLHGIEVEEVEIDTNIIVEKYKFKNVKFASWPYEGRLIPSFDYDVITDSALVRKGDFRICTDQQEIKLIGHLLEPKFNDSFVKWGFMNIIFERKEYFEEYSMEPIAQRMYEQSKELRDKFEQLVKSDTTFAKNGRERINFFYKKSPYYDKKHNFYPIMRVMK